MTTKEQIAYQISLGKLSMPKINNLESKFGSAVYKEIENMFEAMFHTYLKKGAHIKPNGEPAHTVAMPYWAKRIRNPKAHNLALKVLSKNQWIIVSTRPGNNWSSAYMNESKLLEYVNRQTLDNVRMHNKFFDYKLSNTPSVSNNKVTQNGTKLDSGLIRNGFMKTGNTEFQLNTNQINANFDDVLKEVNKGIEKMIVKYPQIATDHANYRELGTEILQYLSIEDATYTSGERASDFRGRNIAGMLSKIGNPIGFKVMRSMLVIPEQYRNIATDKGLRNKHLFIAELCGFKVGTTFQKVAFGIKCYTQRTMTHCFVENLWLENTYEDIDNYYKNVGTYKWKFPIEIDVSASVLAVIGLLLNHKPFMERCNVLPGKLGDAWGHEIITNRPQCKTIMRKIYGSQMTAAAMWTEMDIKFTQQEVEAFDYDVEFGEFAVANRLKDFIIDNSVMKPSMSVRVANETVKFNCNKFHIIGDKTTTYDLYDTHTNTIRRIHNTDVVKVPDLKSFKRVGPTTLVHGLDSQCANNTADAIMNQYNWCLDIHDAFILCAEAADYAREIYSYGRTPNEPSLKFINDNRTSILCNLFTDMGIGASKVAEFKREVLAFVEPLTEKLVINPLVLK